MSLPGFNATLLVPASVGLVAVQVRVIVGIPQLVRQLGGAESMSFKAQDNPTQDMEKRLPVVSECALPIPWLATAGPQ
jgi:hypothetical protein